MNIKYRAILLGKIINFSLFVLFFCLNITTYSATKPKGGNSIILISENLLGGFRNGKWYNASQTFSNLKKEETFKIYTLDKFLGETVGRKPNVLSNDELININLQKLKGEFVAINCNWNPMPRMPRIQNNENTGYKTIIQDILRENGIKNKLPIRIQQIIRVDIESDGSEEVFIMAENVSPLSMYTKNNQYSMMFMRKIVNGVVKNTFIAKDITVTDKEYVEKTPVTYSIIGILDVNGDGIMELLVKSTYYEGLSYMLYDIKNDKVQMLSSIETGA